MPRVQPGELYGLCQGPGGGLDLQLEGRGGEEVQPGWLGDRHHLRQRDDSVRGAGPDVGGGPQTALPLRSLLSGLLPTHHSHQDSRHIPTVGRQRSGALVLGVTKVGGGDGSGE